jgi:hypothetical protein
LGRAKESTDPKVTLLDVILFFSLQAGAYEQEGLFDEDRKKAKGYSIALRFEKKADAAKHAPGPG